MKRKLNMWFQNQINDALELMQFVTISAILFFGCSWFLVNVLGQFIDRLILNK